MAVANVVEHPVPPSAAGGGIRVVHGHRETLRSCRCAVHCRGRTRAARAPKPSKTLGVSPSCAECRGSRGEVAAIGAASMRSASEETEARSAERYGLSREVPHAGRKVRNRSDSRWVTRTLGRIGRLEICSAGCQKSGVSVRNCEFESARLESRVTRYRLRARTERIGAPYCSASRIRVRDAGNEQASTMCDHSARHAGGSAACSRRERAGGAAVTA